MTNVSGAIWRRRMQDLSRNVGKSHAPLFAPLVFGAAAQIEAISVPEMVRNSTRLRKNVSELRRMLGLSAVVCTVPSLMEVEALGAAVNSEVWPPVLSPEPGFDFTGIAIDPARLQSSPRLAASIDMVRQCAGADRDEPVISVALTGPATLAAQLRSASSVGGAIDDGAIYECVGSLLAVLVRLYAEAGVHLIQFHESLAPGTAEDDWKTVLGTAGNVARFHRIPPVLVYEQGVPEIVWPMQAIPCFPERAQIQGARAYALALPSDPVQWDLLPGDELDARVMTSTGDLRPDFPLPDLMAHVRRVCAVV